MTQEELNSLLKELSDQLREIGVPLSRNIYPRVAVNSRARRRLGCCYHVPAGSDRKGAVELSLLPRPREAYDLIEISASLTEKPEKLRETLCHELLHTCRGCKNHGETWKAYADKVNEAMALEIRRLTPADGEEPQRLRSDPVKYVLQCRSCGAMFYRSRMSKLIKYPWRYRCKCGGKLKRLL